MIKPNLTSSVGYTSNLTSSQSTVHPFPRRACPLTSLGSAWPPCFWAALALQHLLSAGPARLPLHRQRAAFSWGLTGKPCAIFWDHHLHNPLLSCILLHKPQLLQQVPNCPLHHLFSSQREKDLSAWTLGLGKECQAKTRVKSITSLVFSYSQIYHNPQTLSST